MVRHLVGNSICVCAAVLAAVLAAAPFSPAQTPPPPAPAATGPATPEQVQAAIEKAQKWLLEHRSKDGTWELVDKPELSNDADAKIVDLKARQWGGLTSLATYALLASGVDHRAPELKPGIDFLLRANIQSTYGLGLSSQITLYLPEKETSTLVKRNVAMLMAGLNQPLPNMIKTPETWPPIYGFYGYWTGFDVGTNRPDFPKDISPKTIGSSQPKGWFDRSNSQYAVLGMWALADAGGEVPTLYWQIVDSAWKKAQIRDGGWNYNGGDPEHREATPSMTAAGIATLFITQDFTLNENWSLCKGGVKNENIERGLHWMDQHISQAFTGDFYTMYGIERIGTASGRKYFGTADWYQIGSDYLVKHQAPDGSWNGTHGQVADTSFSLVFLARGRAPVMMNKLEYGGEHTSMAADAWDERPRDIANLARWVGKEEESYFNWQVVNLKVPAEELHDAPILYLSGAQPVDFTKEEEDKLRAFVEQGGMILGNADCGKETFSKSFTALGHKLFPKYEFKQTAPNDFVYTEQFKKFRGTKPKVMELSNGVRKLFVLIPESDPARAWQTRSSTTREELFGLGANIFLYAVDKKNLMAKGVTYLVHPSAGIATTATLKVARLDAGDNADPEPAGWPRMIGVMHNLHKIDMKVDTVKADALAGYQVADLTGTGKFSLAPASRTAIKKFVDGGGTLIVDAAGGDAEFADSAENEINSIFQGSKLELLDENDPVYNYPGNKIEKVGWRAFAVSRLSDKKHPKLRGIKFGKRTGVFFSREDLSEGIVGQPVDGIYGYDPATATSLMAGMLLYAQTGGVVPAAPPPPASEPAK
jgi:hypothetical protein